MEIQSTSIQSLMPMPETQSRQSTVCNASNAYQNKDIKKPTLIKRGLVQLQAAGPALPARARITSA